CMSCRKGLELPVKDRGSALLFLVLCGAVAFLDRVLFSLVLALFGPPVPFGTFLMVNMGFGIDPDLSVAATRRLRGLRCRNSFGSFLWRRRRRRRCCRRRMALLRCRLFPVLLFGTGRR